MTSWPRSRAISPRLDLTPPGTRYNEGMGRGHSAHQRGPKLPASARVDTAAAGQLDIGALDLDRMTLEEKDAWSLFSFPQLGARADVMVWVCATPWGHSLTMCIPLADGRRHNERCPVVEECAHDSPHALLLEEIERRSHGTLELRRGQWRAYPVTPSLALMRGKSRDVAVCRISDDLWSVYGIRSIYGPGRQRGVSCLITGEHCFYAEGTERPACDEIVLTRAPEARSCRPLLVLEAPRLRRVLSRGPAPLPDGGERLDPPVLIADRRAGGLVALLIADSPWAMPRRRTTLWSAADGCGVCAALATSGDCPHHELQRFVRTLPR